LNLGATIPCLDAIACSLCLQLFENDIAIIDHALRINSQEFGFCKNEPTGKLTSYNLAMSPKRTYRLNDDALQAIREMRRSFKEEVGRDPGPDDP
jgi:hypothetical protein